MRRNSVHNMILNESDSDDELEIVTVLKMEEESRSRRRSIQRRLFIRRNTLEGHQRLFLDYFAESPIYPPNVFRRRIGESTAMKSLKKFVKAVVTIFSDEYLRSPNKNDIARLLTIGQSRGFPGMLGSIDCMHWKWKNCPTAWKGMYSGHIHEPTIILEAVASYDLWIWHAFFGLPGSHNDINVLERSSVFTKLAEGRTPSVNYSINGNDYTMGYYLADGIYPQWSTFVKTIPSPQGNKRKHFAAAQESARKDVERAFGVLQARFAIVRGPARSWERETLKNIMKACIILHNMIVEDERDVNEAEDYDYEQIDENPHVSVSHDHTTELMEFIRRHHHIRDRETHCQLQSDLVEHLWQLHSQS
ncbi:uncharacterized protein LOC114268157 [Camellia sinensis]|uniref:uncharacterized protein LOC114268157 n=1 Tax=Camellia sinensis TaxID=4442 RepID=UPI00103571DF|nr:uncharacterized protein LOC114268157 [Camellia sinensis]